MKKSLNQEIKDTTLDEVVEIAKSMIEPNCFHDFDDGHKSALEDLIETLQRLKS